MKSRRLGRYELVRVLGRGAMGIVYEGRDPNLERRVAIKTVKVEDLQPGAASEYEARFRTEARSAARLQHPHIVTVYDWDRDGNTAFLVMEYVEGHDLKHDLDGGARFTLAQAWAMVRDLLAALGYAHAHGVVHRDIKPANLLLARSGGLKLTDFGVARLQDTGDLTRSQGSMIGTLKYMAPEQVQGLKVDARADLFSAGVVLYQLLTDRRPFDADNDFSIIQQIIGSEPPPPSSLNPGLTPALDAVVAQALAKDREQRFATAQAFADALQAAVEAAPDPQLVPPPGPRPTRPAGAAPVPGADTTPPSVPGLRSSITQELELVYWKDVRESSDPEELESFLDRFPDGVYADLARKRLRRLLEGPMGTDATVLSGLAPASPPAPDLDSLDFALLAAAPATDGEGAAAGAPGAAHASAMGTGPATAAAPAAAAAGPASPPRTARRGRRPWAWLALAALLALGVAGWRLLAPHGADTVAQAVPAVAPPADATPAALPSETASVARGEAAPRPAGPASAAGAASSQRPGANAPATRARPHEPATPARVAEPASRSPSLATAPPAARSEPARGEATSSAPSRAPEAGRPSALAAVEACRDRLFLMRELCLVDACARPGTRNHPLCIQHREEVRLRTEGNPRN